MEMDRLADQINTEVSEVTLMTSETPRNSDYDWQLVDLLLDAQKIIYNCFDKLSAEDENARTAVRKLR